MKGQHETIGVRLNNPGNLEWGSPWQGLVPREQSRYYRSGNAQQSRFCEFIHPADGIRAIARTLITYYDKRKANDGSRIDTIMEVVERWAPSFENNVVAYANHVSKVVGKHPEETLDLRDYDTLRSLVVGIIAHENAGYRYPDDVVDEGMRRAGFVKPRKPKAPIPVNKETVAAGTVAVTSGAGLLAPVLPDVMSALSSNQENLTSTDWRLVVMGTITVGMAIFIAYSQFQRRKAGEL